MFKIGLGACVIYAMTSVVYETVKYIRNNNESTNVKTIENNGGEDVGASSFETDIVGQEDILTFLTNQSNYLLIGDVTYLQGFQYITEANMVQPMMINMDGSTIGAYTILPQFILANPTLVLGMVSNLTMLGADSQTHLYLYLLNSFQATMPITPSGGSWFLLFPQIISALPDYGVMNLHFTSSVVHDFITDLSIDQKAGRVALVSDPTAGMDALAMARAVMGYTPEEAEMANYLAHTGGTVKMSAEEIWGSFGVKK